MVTWLLLAILGQFLYAVSVLVDRYIVVQAEHIGRPIVYAFYISVLSGFVVVLVPLGVVSWPNDMVVLWSFLYAIAFIAAIFFLYSTLRIARASDAAPVVGAISALTTLALAGTLIDGDVTTSLLPSVILLAVGTALISHFHFKRQALVYALSSGVMFGVTIFFSKLVFLETMFLNGLFWTRISTVIVALMLLLVPVARRAIFSGGRRSSQGAKLLVIGNKVMGSVASIVTAFAVSLGSVSIVNALAGLQFVFLFLFVFLFARYAPKLRHKTDVGHGGWQTTVGVSLIVLGVALMYRGL